MSPTSSTSAAPRPIDGRRALTRRTPGVLVPGLLALGVLATPGRAIYAQAAPARDSCAPAPRSPSASAAPATAEQVAALYQSFECHFARKEYAACLPYLEQACQLTDSPRCLLNLGAVHHALMHCQLARGYYQQYLDRAPYDEDVSAARSALDELRRACPQAHQQASAAPAALASPSAVAPVATPGVLPPAPLSSSTSSSPPSAAAQTPLHPRPALDTRTSTDRAPPVLAWTLLGAGAASLTATVVLAAYGARAERDYEARASQLDPAARRSDRELHAIDQRGERSNELALALGVLSGLLTGAGATLWLKDAWQAESGVSLTIAPDGTALSSYSGSF